MRDYQELEDIIDEVRQKITLANRTGNLDELLIQWGLSQFVIENNLYDTYKDGKIVVVGGSAVKENELHGIIKSLGLEKDRFEFCLDYNKAKTYEYSKLRYEPNYRLVMVGAIPHSSTGKHSSGSVISEMQKNDGYPRVEILQTGNELKITKTNFKNTLGSLLEEGFI